MGTGKWADWAGSSFWEEGGKVKALGAEPRPWGQSGGGRCGRDVRLAWELGFVQRPQKVFEESGQVRVGPGQGTGERAFIREPWIRCGGRGQRGQRGPQAEVLCGQWGTL